MEKDLQLFQREQLPKIKKEIQDFLRATTTEDRLLESMLYSLEAGGKHVRPLLLLATLDFFQEPLQQGHYQVAGALEMIHTYSLIHDDLPAMDNDDLRRGKPTNHVVFGEGQAILAGDGLLTEAFHLISNSPLSAEDKVWLMRELAKGAGTSGMIAGQVADIEGEQKELTLAELQRVHSRKTGALIEYAVISGTYLTKQSVEIAEAMKAYGRHFGMAFQIKDDLLDVIGDENLIGKKTGMDAVRHKSTYTSLLGLEGAQAALSSHYQQGMAAIAQVKTIKGRQGEETLLEALLGTLMTV